MKYTTRQIGILGFPDEPECVLMGTWDMDANADKILHILSVVPAEEMQQKVEECKVYPRQKEVCIESETMSMMEVPLWAVPREIGINFLLVEEINPADHIEEGDMGEVIIVETTKTYLEAEERRNYLLSS